MAVHTSRPELTGTHGMVAATHWIAAACGMAVLEEGGNAFDAVAAAGFVLQVVEPHMNGPAGEVPVLAWSERDQAVSVVCGQGVAPAAATVDRFRALGLDAVPGTGLLSATVPGAFGAWLLVLERWGTWRLRDVLRYSIGLARDGFPVASAVADACALVADLFREEWPTSAELWVPGGRAPTAAERFRLPALADTYERIVHEAEARSSTRDGQIEAARDLWYEGFVAESIDRFCRETAWPDTTGHPHAGLLTADDMAAWRATIESPTSYDYDGYTVFKTGSWGQGPVFLQQLALLDAADLRNTHPDSAEYVHLVIEAAKLAFADREAWYGDTPPVTDLVARLTGREYSRARAALIGDRASEELRPGSPDGLVPVLPSVGELGAAARGHLSSVGLGEHAERRLAGYVRNDTCHVDVVDRWGNLVSATPSGGWLQSSPAIPELGFCLGTRAQMFWLEPGHPNSLRPGARPRTTLSPGLAFRDGDPWLAFGTPGGDQQDQWPLQFFLALVHGGLGMQEALDRPTFHSEHVRSSFFPRTAHPNAVVMEERMPPDIVDGLLARGHDVRLSGPWSLGRTCAVARDGDIVRAASSCRSGQSYAVGR